jgi:hypothetical protein
MFTVRPVPGVAAVHRARSVQTSYASGSLAVEPLGLALPPVALERECERLTFDHYVNEVEHHAERRADLDRQLERIARQEPYRDRVAKLSCLRGVSTLSALALVAEIGDFRRFDSPRQLMAFVGLVPSEYSSGGKEKRGGITKTGNSHVRRLLVEAAWSYRHRPAFGPRAKEALRGQPASVAHYARKTQVRLHRRFNTLLDRGKRPQRRRARAVRLRVGVDGGLS